MTVREAIASRRSIRRYETAEVPGDDLALILEAGRLAPSGCNAQPWAFVVTRDPDLRRRLAEETMGLKQNADMCLAAPVLITCLALVDAHCNIPQRVIEMAEADPEAAEPTIARRTGRVLKARFDSMERDDRAAYMAQNTAIALTQMCLQATELGYGTCWMRAFDGAKVRELLAVPEGYEIVAMTPVGRPAEAPGPRPRLALAELVHGERFGEPLAL
jgi:nitroreductase